MIYIPEICFIDFKTFLFESSPEYDCKSFISSLTAVGVIRISLLKLKINFIYLLIYSSSLV